MCPKWLYLGVRYAHHFYIDFSDSTNRGTNFTWKKFPNLVVRLTSVHAPLSYPRGNNKLFVSLSCITAYAVAYILSYEDIKIEKRLIEVEGAI